MIFCCLQEVKYRNIGKKIVELDSGEKYEFHWCGIKCDKDITIDGPDFEDPWIIAFNLKIYGFNIRLVNVYAPTESGGSVTQKDAFINQ